MRDFPGGVRRVVFDSRYPLDLDFIGAIPPPNASWGNMLGGVTATAFKPPRWLVEFAGLAITFAIMTANLFGDALRDFLDPKLRQRID